MEQGIKFTITGDTSGLDKAAKDAENALGKLNSKISQLEKDIADNIRITQGYEKAVEDLSREFKSGIISQDKYAKSLQRLQRDEKETSIETDRLRKELAKLKRDQKSLASVTPTITSANNKLGKSQRKTSASAVEFGRLLGDLPYGIQGVANNIQQLAFVMGAGGALQIGIAVVTGLLTVFRDQFKKSEDVISKFQKEISNVSSSSIVEFKLLTDTVLDTTASQEEQARALEILDNKYSDFDTSLLKNKNTYDKARESIDLYINKLVEQARAQAALKLIEEKATKILEIEEKRRLKIRNSFGSKDEEGLEKRRKSLLELNNRQLKDNESLRLKREKQINERFDSVKTQGEKEIRQLELEIFQLANLANIRDQILFGDSKKQAKTGSKSLATGLVLSFTPQIVSDPKEIAKSTRSYIDSVTGEIKQITSDISTEDLAIINPFSDFKLEVPAVENEAFTNSLEEAFNRTKIFTDAVGSAFSSLGGVISNALATGNAIVDAFVGSITNSLSSLLAEFVANQLAMAVLGKTQIAGEQAKANASGIVVATQGATAFGPLAPLALPGLLASTAATINAAFAPLYTFSQGGIVPGGSFVGDKVPILANGGEMILTAQDQSLLTHVLRGGYAGTTNRGGGQTVEVVGRIRNEDIYLSNKRAAKKNRIIN